MRVLVTGGAGYIGSVTSDALRRAGHEVTVVDRRASPAVDLLDLSATRDVFARARPEAVLHFAAHSQVGESMRKPEKYLGENVTVGRNTIRAALEAGVRRFVLSSTANLYGAPARVPIVETEEIRPGSPYGESKAILEREIAEAFGPGAVALRYFNAAGATEERGEEHDPETHLIPLVLRVAQGRLPQVSIYGTDYPTPDGTCVRDYIHVSDLADAHVLALSGGTGAYNLGTGRGYSVKEVVEAARRVSGHPIPASEAPRRPGDPPILVADASKIRRELGWSPKTPGLEPIIASAWRWMSKR